MKAKALLVKMGLPLVAALSVPAVVFADNYADGDARKGNVTLSQHANWTEIRRVTISIPSTDTETHDCVATASADMDLDDDSANRNRYRFALSHNDDQIAVNTESERTLELIDNDNVDVDDPRSKPVATTMHFRGLTDSNGEGANGRVHRIRLLGRKFVNAADADVLDASLSVVCVDR